MVDKKVLIMIVVLVSLCSSCSSFLSTGTAGGGWYFWNDIFGEEEKKEDKTYGDSGGNSGGDSGGNSGGDSGGNSGGDSGSTTAGYVPPSNPSSWTDDERNTFVYNLVLSLPDEKNVGGPYGELGNEEYYSIWDIREKGYAYLLAKPWNHWDNDDRNTAIWYLANKLGMDYNDDGLPGQTNEVLYGFISDLR
jgi:hypothetical protein